MQLRSTIVSNMLWRFLERVGAQAVGFIVGIILARLLDPSVYGQIALVNVFIIILQVFIDSGLGNALIQKEEVDDLDYSSVFTFNIIACVFVYIVLFVMSTSVALFLGDPSLTLVVRVAGLTIIVSGVKNIQQAYISKNMMFKKFFFSTSIGTIISAVISIYLAFSGYGIWALVLQGVINNTIDTIVLWITVKWMPKLAFSWKRFKNLFNYGWKLLASSLIDTLYNKIKTVLIGKIYSPADLAFFNYGDMFPNLLVANINASIDSVLFPAMSESQRDKDRIRNMTCRSIKTSTYILAPLMIGLAVCARPLVIVLLTEKWLDSVFYIQIFALVYLFYPIHTANLNAIKAMGRSDLFLRLEIIKKIIGIIVLAISMMISVKAIAVGAFITSVISQLINSLPNKKLLGYSYKNQMLDILSNIVLAVVMGGFVYWIPYVCHNYLISFILQVVLGIAVYVFLSAISKNESYVYLIQVIKCKFINERD